MSKLKLIYLYIFSSVGLILIIIGGVSLINLGLKTYIFTKADQDYYYRIPVAQKIIIEDGVEKAVEKELTEEEIKEQEETAKEQRSAQRQRDAAQAVAMLIVGIPLYTYHWRQVRKKD